MRAGRGWIFGISAIAVVALPAGASAEVFCDYVDAGPAGPAGNVLAVNASGELDFFEPEPEGEDENLFANAVRVTPRRDGTISVIGPGRTQVPCAGGEPTLANIDLIRVFGGESAFVVLDLGGRQLAPGATDEENGSSEIEVAFVGTFGSYAVRGGAGSDRFSAVGPDNDEPFGLNLNPRADGERPEWDVDLTLAEYTFLALLGDGGADRLTVEPAVRPSEEEFPVYFHMIGGPGDDTILDGFEHEGEADGGRGDDLLRSDIARSDLEGDELHAGPAGAHLQGGDGPDALFGGAANDRLQGDGGRDRLIGRGGSDSILAEDGARDWIDCGPGHDRVLKSDRPDRRRRCEPWPRDPGPSEIEEALEEAENVDDIEVAVEQVGR